MELVLLIALIDPARVGAFTPAEQVFQYVTPAECAALKEYYADDPYRRTFCLTPEHLAENPLDMDALIASTQG